MKKFLNQLVNYHPLLRIFVLLVVSSSATYLVLIAIIDKHAHDLLQNSATQKYDAALILGNRTHLHGAPNPCLTGRVDKGLLLAQQDIVSMLAMTGGRDNEDYRIESEFMAAYARGKGYKGPILTESQSHSTKENLEFSVPILKAANIKSVIIVSEPYHMWRTEKLVEAGHLGHDFNVAYAAAPSQCWTKWGMLFKGALREPAAIINNYAKGYFNKNQVLTP